MKPGRKDEIAACCMGILRNAEKFIEDLGFDQELEITIRIKANALPTVLVSKAFLPKEVVDLWKTGDVIE